ncbi:MAG: hypothetical protein NTW10_01185 [Bacteroidetes bacterium]|nr:hypothetical protein [Bacteroidota bacterium]
MEETSVNKPNSEKKNQDCGCDDGCCQPKKKNPVSKIIFAVILLAAVAIIGIKLTGHSGNRSSKQSVAAPGKAGGCDTTKKCDTTKGSSCCPKN